VTPPSFTLHLYLPFDASMTTRTFSLWLTPSAAVSARLSSEIARLSALHSAPIFSPHVTLLTPAAGATEEACRAASAALAASLTGALYAKFLDVEAGADANHWRFRCVFLRVHDDEAIHKLHAAARSLLPPSAPDEGYMPHLSLLYSDIDAAARTAARDDAARALSPFHCEGAPLEALALWDTTSARPEAWTLVAEFPLGQFPRGLSHQNPQADS
jgi:hypothetical protein